MDPFKIKLLIFYAVILAILVVTRIFPNSIFTRTTFMWYGPTPRAGQTKSKYLFGWTLYSLKWFLFFGLTLYLVSIVIDRFFHNQFNDNIYFQMLFMFAFPLLMMMALVGGIGCSVKGVYLMLLKKDFYYSEAETIDRGDCEHLVVADNDRFVVCIYIHETDRSIEYYHSINNNIKKNKKTFEFLYLGRLTVVPLHYSYPHAVKETIIKEFIESAEGLPKSIEWEEDVSK